MRIRLLKVWNHQPIGSVLDIGRGVALELIKRNIAEKVEEPTMDKWIRRPMKKGAHAS